MVQTLGDNAYDKGTPRQFGCYHDTWGVALERTHPALGGHDYMTEGAAGYFGYFGDVLAPYAPTATDPTMGWYAYDLGQWRVIVLNSICDRIGGCDGGSPQVAWLRAELAAHPATCSLAVIHNPRFSSGRKENEPRVGPLWEELDAAGVEMVLSGDNHAYERLAPMRPSGDVDPASRHPPVRGRNGRPEPLQVLGGRDPPEHGDGRRRYVRGPEADAPPERLLVGVPAGGREDL